MIKPELENKNIQQRNLQVTNPCLNPQYIRPPLQILQGEKKKQQDHTHHPLYIEDDMGEKIQDANKVQGNLYSSFSDKEQKLNVYEEEEEEIDATLNDDEVDVYSKWFIDIMQAQLHKKYYMWSSRQRSRGKGQNDGTCNNPSENSM